MNFTSRDPRLWSRELLNRLLEGELPSSATVSQLLDLSNERRSPVEEDQYLDYKRWDMTAPEGNEGKSRAEWNRDLRKFVSGFANADGGVLVLGVAGGDVEPQAERWTVTGFGGDADPSSWVSSALAPIAGHLIPPPRVACVDVQGKAVVFVAVGRATRLFPVDTAQGQRTFVRFHASTQPVPDYLLQDLMLGRRSQPRFHVSGSCRCGNPGSGKTTVTVEAVIKNDSLVWAESIQVGFIGFQERPTDLTGLREQEHDMHNEVPSLLRAYIDIDEKAPGHFVMVMSRLPKQPLPPFQTLADGNQFTLDSSVRPRRWLGAIWVSAPNATPCFAQVDVEFPAELPEPGSVHFLLDSVTPLSPTDRARVALETDLSKARRDIPGFVA